MCSIETKPQATACMSRVEKNLRNRLVELAAADCVEFGAGLELMLDRVDDWAKGPDLKWVRKYTLSRHRLYITGRHSDCKYVVCHVMLFKRVEDDKPDTKKFKKMIMSSLEGTTLPLSALGCAE